MKVSELVKLTKIVPELSGRVYHTFPQKNPPFPCAIIARVGRFSALQYDGVEVTKSETFSLDVYHTHPSKLENLVENINALYIRNDIIPMSQFDAFELKDECYRTNLTYRLNTSKGITYRG